ncbi:MAG: hypothetical protein KAJ19_12415 [Gammaproteobacteria bacterium]|nr:hypothetical protein [Gammaproteobacteria bacterium]
MIGLITRLEEEDTPSPSKAKKPTVKQLAKSKDQIASLSGAEGHRTPVFIRHCVRAVVKDQGRSVSDAFGICVAGARKSGYIHPGRPIRITRKGRVAAKKHASDPDHEAKNREYKGQLKKSRKSRGESLSGLIERIESFLE